ncbi:MAG: UDP-3-O-acyl-N-acetylglucosamine deacetylase [Bacteroidales bacterium]|jgi:UDP-3-O-[3-hydroxymyristoyl] N-acetylglucosamine deacetylase/3-hydroxyacyl-[acyl-carrier-protein] dehydratase|nr:UDP-3-O-acyl-N-acetylglucosamine deacetylase [Bacteroidales bacterium]
MKQKTITKEVTVEGKGLHFGKNAKLTIKSALPNTGYVFVRKDIADTAKIKAIADNVCDSSRNTTISKNGISISTIEHLLAATYALGIDNVVFEIDAPEVPILEGNSKCFIDLYKQTEIVEQDAELKIFDIKKELEYSIQEKGIKYNVFPDENLKFKVFVDFNISEFSNQEAELINFSDFEKKISTARTFVFLSDIEKLANANLIQGGNLDNAIIIIDVEKNQKEYDELSKKLNKPTFKVQKKGEILNNTKLYFPNEQARHKLLDVVGDLALTGYRFNARIQATHPGHFGNAQLAKIIRNYIKNSI